ncbi:bifunctional DNA primase/polymerase [Cellulosilyticum lentocellum]|uniref:Bifunctional DNA primase/polymerase n=1 Tax=Cellulosilyticum lentocellum (strain ATCC 49066 / DSM 5427 / NCIMB 11756 / RHM5) TaxID=642492 RepID=F2JHT0_CELLD|nr:bifunctional DNA primase/polymerase [Cellulosilyticum lentocellum]ADZ85422.1 Bifunctional DNA primase/polymerase [Cellulosilyticum lentocellum DSM 5427]
MPNEVLRMALKYAEIGIPVMPLHGIKGDGNCTCKKGSSCSSKGKHPIFNGWQELATTNQDTITKWWSKYPDANIGIPTGERSGWLVLDVDTKYQGDESLELLQMLYEDLPPTVTALTGSGGRHLIFKYPKGVHIPNKVSFKQGLDTRSNGGLIVATPSLHVSGNTYSWLEGHSPFDSEPVEAPEWLLEVMCEGDQIQKREVVYQALETSTATVFEGSRNNHLTSLAGTLRRKGMSESGIIVALMAENEANCEPPLEVEEVRTIARSIGKYEPNKANLKPYYNRTDSGNAERFRDLYGKDIRYCHILDKWFIWNGQYWEADSSGRITELAIKTVRTMLEEAQQIQDDIARRELVKHALKSEGFSRIKAMISLASDLQELTITTDELDKDIWKINCQNGIIDLKTGELLSHDRKYFYT